MAELILDDAPRKVRDMYQKGFAAFERGNLEYAMDMFMAVLDLEPQLLEARKLLRAAAVKNFKNKGGGQMTHTMSSLSGMGKMMGANSALKKNPAKAMQLAEKLMRSDPLNKSFIKVFGQAAVAAEMPEAAIQTLEIAKEYYPKDVELIKWLAELYMETNLTRKGRECYEDIVRIKPNDQIAIKNLKDAAAVDTMQKGGWSDAKSYRDIMKDEKGATLLEQEARSVKTGDSMDALIKDLEQKTESEPDNINYRRALADLYSKNGQFEEALATIEEAAKRAGGDPQIDRARSSIRLERFERVIKQLQDAGDEAGFQAKTAEKDEFLLADAKDRVARYPNDLQFKYDLGLLLFQRDEINEAIQQFQQSQRNPQRRQESLYYMGLCFKSKKQYQIAADQLEKAGEEISMMNNTKKDILYELGLIYEAMGDRDKAMGNFKEIYAVDISFRDVAERVEKGYAD